VEIPNGMTLEDVTKSIEKSANILCPKFAFGYYDEDDLRQECFIWTIELLSKGRYDPTQSLDSYIYSHLFRRLINLKRNVFHRNDPPCKLCHANEPCMGRGQFCKKYLKWKKRNSNKANLIKPLDITNVADEHEQTTRTNSTVEYDAFTKEIVDIIDRDLPVEMRMPFLQMKAGVSVPKNVRTEVEDFIKGIMKEVFEWQREES
jgi:hypothetical protein